MRSNPKSRFPEAAAAGVVALMLAAIVIAAEEDVADWRPELLEDEGISLSTDALQELQKGFEISSDRLEKALVQLGADEFVTREQAQRDILLMGREVLPSLRRLPSSDDPEVRMRLAAIEQTLSANGRWAKADLLRHAVTSLLRERLSKDAGEPANLVFAEFFRHAAPSLADGYRRFRFEADKGMIGLVSEGVLRMKGNHAGDGDQRLLLDAKELTGKDELPDDFRIEVKLGGEAGGEGAYHVGVSVGHVRALYHPGYETGGFRFERVDDHTWLTPNTAMGFTPSTKDLQRMSIDVKRLADGRVEMRVAVTNRDKTFRERKILEKNVIGKLDRIGLDRSGRTGGDGLFDDFVADLGSADRAVP